jgi:pyruvate kinase
MRLPEHKTKIVATIGPASNSPDILERLIRAGMNVARLNFSHGNFEQHAEVIERIRNVSKAAGRRVAIMGELPGPKMGLGTIRPDPIQVVSGDTFTLTRGSSQNLFQIVRLYTRLGVADRICTLVVDTDLSTGSPRSQR